MKTVEKKVTEESDEVIIIIFLACYHLPIFFQCPCANVTVKKVIFIFTLKINKNGKWLGCI